MLYQIYHCRDTFEQCRAAKEFRAWIPVEKVLVLNWRGTGRSRKIPRAAMPGYIFIPAETALAYENWCRRSFLYCRPLLDADCRPAVSTLKELHLMQEELRRMTPNPAKPPLYHVNQKVEIGFGPFAGKLGKIVKIGQDGQARLQFERFFVWISVNLLKST